MRRPLAFVLGGGGARGAFQVGALRALLETDIRPDILVGTSIGALNAAYWACKGLDRAGLQALESQWLEAKFASLFPTSSPSLLMRFLLNRFGFPQGKKLRDFFLSHEMTTSLRFGDISGVRLFLVASDLNGGNVVTFGKDEDSVLEGLVASSAIPPWVHPIEKDGRFLVDGGILSNLSIEAAVEQGARKIIAFDLSDPREVQIDAHGFTPFYSRLSISTEKRIRELETRLALAQGIPVHTLALRGLTPLNQFDFSAPESAIDEGYRLTRKAITENAFGNSTAGEFLGCRQESK